MTQVLIASGANGTLGAAIMALINKDDEMIIFEPAFPMYIDHCELSGGTLKTVPMNVNEEGIWVFDKE